jgi:soluble lytic murein transglycosylase
LAPGPRPTPIEPDVRERFALIATLQQAGLVEEATAVLETIVDAKLRRPEEMLGLSKALAEHGFGQDAVRLGWRAHARLRGVWTESVLRAVYPLAFTEIIDAEASSRELDPFLVAAIARQESAFDPDVVSRAGARGLLQLMPATGRWWAGRLGIRDYSNDLLFHPETNVHLGTAYFADLQRRYGELQISLVAYNAGPTRARRWRQRPEYADPELFAERIPLSETRSYVRNVQSHYRIYRQIYGASGSARSAD